MGGARESDSRRAPGASVRAREWAEPRKRSRLQPLARESRPDCGVPAEVQARQLQTAAGLESLLRVFKVELVGSGLLGKFYCVINRKSKKGCRSTRGGVKGKEEGSGRAAERAQRTWRAWAALGDPEIRASREPSRLEGRSWRVSPQDSNSRPALALELDGGGRRPALTSRARGALSS